MGWRPKSTCTSTVSNAISTHTYSTCSYSHWASCKLYGGRMEGSTYLTIFLHLFRAVPHTTH